VAPASMNLPLSLEELILNFLGLPTRKPSSRSRGCSLCLGQEFRVLIVNNKGYECFNLDTIARVMHLFGKPVIHNERPLLKKSWQSIWRGSEQDEYALLWYDSKRTQSEEAFVYPEPHRSPEEILRSWLNEPMPDIALYTCLRDSRHQEENTNLPVGNYLLDDIYHLPDYGYYRVLHSAVIPSMTRLELLNEPLRLFGGIPLAEWMDPALSPVSHEKHIVKIIALPNHRIFGNPPKSSYPCYCADYIAVSTTLLGYTDLKANELALLLALWLNALNETGSRTVSPILSFILRFWLNSPSSAHDGPWIPPWDMHDYCAYFAHIPQEGSP
jgi:hypothetical protein